MSFHTAASLPEDLRDALSALGNEGVSAQTLVANYLDEVASGLAYDTALVQDAPNPVTREQLLAAVSDVQDAVLAARIALGDTRAAEPALRIVNTVHSPGHSAADLRLIEKASDQYHRDGEIEIDDTPIISRGATGGAYIEAWVWQDYDLREKLEFAISEQHVPADETLVKITATPKPDDLDDAVWTLLGDLVKEDYGSLTPASVLVTWPPEYDADEEDSEAVLYAALEQQYGTP